MEVNKISIKQIKDDLLRGINSPAIDYLKTSTSTLVFQEFKEQKLLLYAPQDEPLKNEYINSVKRLLQSEIEIKEELAYINFVEVYIAETTRLYDDLLKTVDKNLLVNVKTFLFNIISAVDEHVNHMLQAFYQDFEKDDITTNTPNELTEKHEWAFNGLRGKLNDVMFAVTRLINSYPFLCENIDVINTSTKYGIERALTICSKLNSFDYALDKISYDEWYVFKKDKMEDEFFFRIKDLNLEKARDLGLKRELSSLMLGIQKNKRWLQEFFANPIMEIFEWIWEYYQNKNTIILNENDIYESAKNSIISSLKSLGADDELLVSTENDKSEVLPYYYAAAILNTFSRVNQEFKLSSLRNKFDYTAPEIPIDFANSIFNRLGRWKNNFQYYLHHLSSSIPTRQHFDLLNSPYIQMGENTYSIDNLSIDNWSKCVKMALMKGGHSASVVGELWEEYIKRVLEDHNWENVKKGIKIKENKKTITDIDLLAKKDNLLLVIQMKVYYGSGSNCYEQHKFRKKLEYGAQQAILSEQSIRNNINILKPYFSESQLTEITYIIPIVMTNSHFFNGWNVKGIPIMSTSSLMQILNGTHVKFTTSDGKVFFDKKYINSNIATTEEFISFLSLPLDWRIGAQNYEVKYHEEVFKNSTLNFPILINEDNKIDNKVTAKN